MPAVNSVGRESNIQLPMKAGETFKVGALVVIGASGIEACTADPASVYGVAEEAAGLNPVDATKVLVQQATEEMRWWFPVVGTAAATDVGVLYAYAIDADGIGCVDLSDTGHDVFYVHQVDTVRNLVEVSIIAAVRQIAP